MPEYVKLAAQQRAASGSAAARRLRREGWLPAVINNEKGESVGVKLNRHGFEMLMRHHASENLIADVEVEGASPKRVLLREVQHDPVTDTVIHVDFVEISMTRKMKVNIPIELVGAAAGVHEGGILDHHLRFVEIECLPSDLVESLPVDVTALKIGDALRVSDIKLPAGLTVLTPGDMSVASVALPREEEEVPAEAAAEGAAEPEVITERVREGEEEAEGAEKGAKDAKAGAKDAKAGGKESKPGKEVKAGGKEAKPGKETKESKKPEK